MLKLTKEEKKRYLRHILLNEIGESGQEKLKNASVLIIGVGGLGSPASLYLAAAGIGKIGLMDFDNVEESNLQRQIVFSVNDLGKCKAESAKARLLSINPCISIEAHSVKADPISLEKIVPNYNLIIDGTDNFKTRYLVNDTCLALRKSNIHGSVSYFNGQLSVFNYENGPCYRCLFPKIPPLTAFKSCAEGGVIGALPGIIGTMQAIEAIKIIVGIGDILSKKVLIFDSLSMDFSKIEIKKNTECFCGKKITMKQIKSEFMYEDQHCDNLAHVKNITCEELNKKIKYFKIIDIRKTAGLKNNSIPGSINIPINKIKEETGALSRKEKIVIYCRTGVSSKRACEILKENDFKNVYNLIGGFDEWSK